MRVQKYYDAHRSNKHRFAGLPISPPSLESTPVSIKIQASSLTQATSSSMSASREGPNPLRPYYIPPSVGHASNASHHATSPANLGSKNVPTSTNSFGSSARNILADMDYSEYISDSPPSPTAMMKGLVEQAIWKYSSVFLAQPFEVSKTILQAQVARQGQKQAARVEDDMRRRPGTYRRDSYEVNYPLTKVEVHVD